jgi:hypothetical protein
MMHARETYSQCNPVGDSGESRGSGLAVTHLLARRRPKTLLCGDWVYWPPENEYGGLCMGVDE